MKWLPLVILSACHSATPLLDLSVLDASVADRLITASDSDGDGLSDDEEAMLASAYLPFLSVAASDTCPTNGLVVRVTPAEIAGLVRLRYAWLFDQDCDIGNAGVEGGIGELIDPTKVAPGGIVSLRTVSRPDSFCQQLSTCGQCPGQLACEMLGGKPAVWAALDRHAIYATKSLTCIQTEACMGECIDATVSAMPQIVNIGEPETPLVHDLTTQGFITAALGWQSQALYDYDPFGGLPFGQASSVSELLVDQVSRIDPPGCAL